MAISKSIKASHVKGEWQDIVFDYINLFLIIVVLLIMLYPLYLVVICSFSDANMVSLGQVTLYPKGITFAGYQAMFENRTIWRSYLNSTVYTIVGTLLSVTATLGAAFTLSRKFPGRKLISFIFVFTMFFNGGLIPTFIVMRDIKLYNNPWICILMGGISVWNIMVARTYISSTIPESLYEAAVLDGASKLQYFFRVVMPLSGTIIAVLSVYYGVDRWNDFWTGLIYISERDYLPLQTVLKDILASLQTRTDLTNSMLDDAAEAVARAQLAKYCVIVISTLPAIVLYLFMQKFFVKGVMIGSIKG